MTERMTRATAADGTRPRGANANGMQGSAAPSNADARASLRNIPTIEGGGGTGASGRGGAQAPVSGRAAVVSVPSPASDSAAGTYRRSSAGAGAVRSNRAPAADNRDAQGAYPRNAGGSRDAGGVRAERGGTRAGREARGTRAGGAAARDTRASDSSRGARSSRATRSGATAGTRSDARSGARRSARSGSAASATAARSGSKAPLIAVIAIIAIAALVVGYVVLSHSSLLRIERIEAVGVEHLTADEVEILADVPEDATLLTVDETAIRNNLLQDAWVKDVEVVRIPPGTLRLNVTEREVLAVVSIPSANATTTRRWLISTDEIWLMPVPETSSEAAKTTSSAVFEDADTALKITDVPYGEQPEIGKKNTNEYVQLAIDVVNGLTTSLKDRVVAVQAKDTLSVTLVLDNNVQIVFGNTDDIRDKERVCLELLERYPDELSYINVRSVDNPTWRSI